MMLFTERHYRCFPEALEGRLTKTGLYSSIWLQEPQPASGFYNGEIHFTPQ